MKDRNVKSNAYSKIKWVVIWVGAIAMSACATKYIASDEVESALSPEKDPIGELSTELAELGESLVEMTELLVPASYMCLDATAKDKEAWNTEDTCIAFRQGMTQLEEVGGTFNDMQINLIIKSAEKKGLIDESQIDHFQNNIEILWQNVNKASKLLSLQSI